MSDLNQTAYWHTDNTLVAGLLLLNPLMVFEVFGSSLVFNETQIFRAAMIKASALMIGSSAMAAIGVSQSSNASHLDILVGLDQYCEDTVQTVRSYHKHGRKSVNIVETQPPTVWKHILTSPSTAHTTFLSATHAFVLYPDQTFVHIALLCNTDFPSPQCNSTVWTCLAELGWVVCRNNACRNYINQASCPALCHSLWGGEGIWHGSWSSVLDSGNDYYYQVAASGFKHDDIWLSGIAACGAKDMTVRPHSGHIICQTLMEAPEQIGENRKSKIKQIKSLS
ncbi:hypothetical protein BT96DRAFT_947593 [Gymnopus androsaceus JB14]|uniref:Uncharacterized protein n=1 Tax=Gymnopus androsaceus JB14 TaxID=1447944 RepID=A0A6A4GT31_9AGAR|nr:hypothetical protein BT96DRAFT_947593 [Gymnopus androsaceus JB14]